MSHSAAERFSQLRSAKTWSCVARAAWYTASCSDNIHTPCPPLTLLHALHTPSSRPLTLGSLCHPELR